MTIVIIKITLIITGPRDSHTRKKEKSSREV